MNNKDYIFLYDYLNYGCKNHVLAALALYKAVIHEKEIAQKFYKRTEDLSLGNSKLKDKKSNKKASVQSIMLAKLYAEYVASLEDFGALLYAIKNRNKSSIFGEYINCQAREVANFFDKIKNEDSDLSKMLNIPPINQLTKLVDNKIFNDVKKCYEEYPKLISEIAKVYRNKSIVQSDINAPSELSEGYNNYLYIILGLRDCKKNKKEESLMTKTFNKIRHRFTVINNVYDFLKAEPNCTLNYVLHKIEPEWANQLLTSIINIEICTENIITLIITLKDNKVDI